MSNEMKGKVLIIGAALMVGLSTATYLYAAGPVTLTPPPNSFSSGTAISSSAVNTDFSALLSNETALDAQLGNLDSGNWSAGSLGIAYTGNVSIGMLPVTGKVLSLAGNLWVVGTITDSSGLVTSSDQRLKKDITTLPSALDDLTKLRGVTFHWIDPKKGTQLQYGVIAQEVETVYPDLVSTDPNGMKCVNYNGFVAPLIESVKALKAASDQKDQEIADLRQENATLQKRLDAIEAKLGM